MRITSKFKLFVSFVFFWFLCAPVSSASAQESAIVDLVVANSKHDLLAFFKIDEAFSEELQKGVQHGIPVTFTFDIVLEMTRSGWLDKEIYNGSFNHTMTYDNLKKEYTVVQVENDSKQIVTTDLEQAMQYMTEVNSYRVVPLDRLYPDRLYTLKVKATLEKTTLPLNFHYLIPFTEFWDLKTDWTKVEFRY